MSPWGNSFLLRSAFAQSGLDKILQDYSKQENKKDFIYAGFSAGICILAPTLKGIDKMDHPNLVREIYGTEIIWKGLGIISYSIVPHYQSDHKETYLAEVAVNYLKENNLPYKTLKDGEVIIEDTIYSKEGKLKQI